MTADASDLDDVVRVAEALLAQSREELRRADSKALQGLAVVAALAVLWSAPLAEGIWRPGLVGWSSQLGWWLGWALWCSAAGSFGAAAFPWLSSARTESVVYFGDVSRLAGNLRRLSAALSETASTYVEGLLAELAWTSRTAMRKYQLVRVGFAAIALATVVMLLAFA